MLFVIKIEPPELFTTVHELIRMALPTHEIKVDSGQPGDGNILLRINKDNQQISIYGYMAWRDKSLAKTEAFPLSLDTVDYDGELKRLVKVFVYRFLSEFLGKNINDYGIFSGVRPLKMIHRQLDKGYSNDEIINVLQKDYLLTLDKARLLLRVAANNRAYLLTEEEARKTISIYIGIPYCPSRCYYCSFPGGILKDYSTEIKPFLKALFYEIATLGNYINENNYKVQTLYIGGGTPSILKAHDLEELFNHIKNQLITESCQEITFEAGRPDTLNAAKLQILKQAGVNRICINPQTMNDSTLIRIGRQHSAQDIIKMVDLVRQTRIPIINMDLIVGLPGEVIADNRNTVTEIINLKPENITLHSLAVKKGSNLALLEGRKGVEKQSEEVKQGMELLNRTLQKEGYLPYYLYRQKYMKASLENIGYALPGTQCIYNIQMMEARQTIIGLGGGSASKFVNPEDWSYTSLYNPKDPQTYIASLDKYIQAKVDKLNALN